jgi:hypothetical protein
VSACKEKLHITAYNFLTIFNEKAIIKITVLIKVCGTCSYKDNISCKNIAI